MCMSVDGAYRALSETCEARSREGEADQQKRKYRQAPPSASTQISAALAAAARASPFRSRGTFVGTLRPRPARRAGRCPLPRKLRTRRARPPRSPWAAPQPPRPHAASRGRGAPPQHGSPARVSHGAAWARPRRGPPSATRREAPLRGQAKPPNASGTRRMRPLPRAGAEQGLPCPRSSRPACVAGGSPDPPGVGA